MFRTYCHSDDGLIAGEVRLDAAPVWHDLRVPTAMETSETEALLGISIPTREEMQDIEVSSRLYYEDGAEFMTVTAVTKIDTDDPELTPVTFVLKGQTLLTVRFEQLKAFADFASRAQRTTAVPSATGEQVMFGLIEALSDRMADTLVRSALDIDSVSRDVFRKKRKAGGSAQVRDLEALIEQIGRNGDLLTKVRESLVSINRLLTYHAAIEQADKKASRETQARVKTLHRDVIALTDQTAFLSNKVNFLLDATLGLINLQQSQIIKIFSVAAVVFLPPTLIASIYGMNFAHMPELRWHFGYPFAVALMLISAILPYWFFKRRGWL